MSKRFRAIKNDLREGGSKLSNRDVRAYLHLMGEIEKSLKRLERKLNL